MFLVLTVTTLKTNSQHFLLYSELFWNILKKYWETFWKLFNLFSCNISADFLHRPQMVTRLKACWGVTLSGGVILFAFLYFLRSAQVLLINISQMKFHTDILTIILTIIKRSIFMACCIFRTFWGNIFGIFWACLFNLEKLNISRKILQKLLVITLYHFDTH